MTDITIRPLQEKDNRPIASIIRNTLAEFGANHPGTVYFDPTTDNLFQLFKTPGSYYLVAEANFELLGGAGIFPSDGLPDGTCELVKMYLVPEARSMGLGKKMIEQVLAWAKNSGYGQVYIETMPELEKAMKVYEKFGFEYLDGPMGNTGHTGCSIWMLKKFRELK
ncbi:MAG: GNAT family N-acetyltransferase [Chitinophagaceae bacterium]|nr:GNAT family N-acetyltransferase [Chitinophagaceae bacterium]